MSNILKSLRTWLQQGNHAQWTIFFLLSNMIFVKCVLFHWFYFHSVILSSLFHSPVDFLCFYLPKIIVSILLACFVFLTKRHYWTSFLLFIIDGWSIANIVYHNANDLPLDVNAILMANNLSGFESAISTFLHWEYMLFPILTIAYTFLLPILRCKKCNYTYWGVLFSICILSNLLMCLPNWLAYHKGKKDADFDMANGRQIIIELCGWNGWHYFIPFHDVKMCALPDLTYYPDYARGYIYDNTIIHYAAAMVVFYANSEQNINVCIQNEELKNMFLPENKTNHPHPNTNVIFILVESLESWALELGDISTQATPNLVNFINQDRIYYANHIRSEARHGVSGDGQMLVSSGMMPINAGAACILYGNNEWPSYISLFPHSVFIDINSGIWNQRTMSHKYGYKHDSYPSSERTDLQSFETLKSVVDTISPTFFAMALTGATHSPFHRHHGYRLSLPKDMPEYMREYLECLHYTDSCFGVFMNHFKDNPYYDQTTIIVTGDHTVFKTAMLSKFHQFAIENDLHIPDEESYCPLIIYSPKFKEKQIDTALFYQMDIYPTILHLIGCEDYYWHGFGVNLLDEEARHNRPIDEQEAYRLSDLMIRSDYFRQ